MLYANVVFGLPIDGPFDYLVPADLEDKLVVGARVWVNFRNKKEVAYVVGLNNKTKIKKLKEIVSVIDFFPVLDDAMLKLTKELAEYYCCSWGEAIDAALPDEIRKGKINVTVSIFPEPSSRKIETVPFIPLFVQGQDRIPVYLREIKKVLAAEKSVIILCSNIPAVERLKEIIQNSLGKETFIAFRKQPKELEVWEKIRQAGYCVVVGTRSSVFSPVNNPGLIIIDQPEDSVYKQEQAPHYHARQVAWMRAEICGAKVILGSHCLSLESFYLLQKGELDLEIIPSKLTYPQVKVIDVRRLAYAERKSKSMFSKFLLDAIQLALVEKGKVLLVINRKGFATTVACHDCGSALKCPRCNINLVLHFELDKLKCHHCNFEMPVPKICPDCNTGYIKYFGLGTEKVESELARIFPQARLGQDIVVETSAIINHQELSFDLIGVMAIDNSLNRVDFRAAEKTFALLAGLVSLTAKKMIIQSANVNHHCFQALIKNDPQIFLKEELRQRKQLQFAPFKHMILLKVRGADLEKVKKAAQDLFQRLNKIKTMSLKLLSLNPGQPAQLRGNFYYQILMRAPSVEKASHFLKLHLKETHLSGIIVTVDVDPV
ncbi:MAG: primosomal protein N' [Candidatus Omnitrophica bacterium]|nr:primosomal protein N' [Candidatus Omnitrophota bacterium]MBU4303640.1 primosomal protein N' [Candidatus Omnitrophota bacterium]MBU4418565.1 primosomal protein N' [Candidatus Omnitrophota bacterium]MBU4467234.1 primosomal protein N' [Candidatus Omnitrophota bacterium]MCG2707634.1 primosomal protein N' [Candidatus Omnitrophota bacterium]